MQKIWYLNTLFSEMKLISLRVGCFSREQPVNLLLALRSIFQTSPAPLWKIRNYLPQAISFVHSVGDKVWGLGVVFFLLPSPLIFMAFLAASLPQFLQGSPFSYGPRSSGQCLPWLYPTKWPGLWALIIPLPLVVSPGLGMIASSHSCQTLGGLTLPS